MSARTLFLSEYPKAIVDDTAAIFVGAGVSMGAGYPSWKDLLKDIGDELGVQTSDVHDLAALAQWSVRKSAGRTRVNNVIRTEIAPERPIPLPLEILARLPVRNIWTTNYDRLIERAFSAIGRPIDAISATADLALRPRAGASRLYKMHGSVDRLDDIVIATDDYELYRLKRGAYLPLLQAHMTSYSILFIGLSFTDPNVRHVLSLIRESFTGSPPEHYAIVRPPQRTDFKTAREFKARAIQHDLWADDLQRYGLRVVPIAKYSEVDDLMIEVERRVASHRVWISGSWPSAIGGGAGDPGGERYVAQVAAAIGQKLGESGFSLVSGMGLTVGAASVSGFLEGLRRTATWDLERRLIVRPFPQPIDGRLPSSDDYRLLRSEMARMAGAVVFVGGSKIVDDKMISASGVMDELEAARAAGRFLLPVGATGGSARAIADELLKEKGDKGALSRPSKHVLRELLERAPPDKIATAVVRILHEQVRSRK
jgi:hypothetical protein